MKERVLSAFVVLLAAHTGWPATILERTIEFAISGSVMTEHQILVVAMDEPGDLESWAEYPVWLNEEIELENCSAQVLDSNGRVVETVRKRDFREVTSVGFGLYSSAYALVIPLPMLHVGQRIRIELVRVHRPYFPAHSVRLTSASDQQKLRVTVRGDTTLRWTLQNAKDIVSLADDQEGIELTGRDLPADHRRAFAADADATMPTLRFAWGSDATWQALGRWYEDLISGLSDRSGAVSALADRLTEGLTTDRERLVALADYVKRRVRYEAVEIGPGGYIPTVGGTVLDRGWGDCKDKARLLAELLDAVGIPSHPVLIRSGRSARIDVDFPSHLQFNHAILAVPARAVEVEAGDPVVDGFLFIDATMDRGGPLWLSPYCQGHWALVVDGEQSRLVRIPVLIQLESRVLSVAGNVDDEGDFSGTAALRLRGSRALGWLRDFDSEDPARIDEAIHLIMQRLTGAEVTSTAWRDLETEVPAVLITADLRIAGLARGAAGRRRVRAPLLQGLPEARTMDARSEPLVLTPGRHRTTWKIHLPDGWCPVVPADSEIRNSTGTFTFRAAMHDANTLVIDGAATVSRWWFGPESFGHLRALSIEESRTSRRSLRLRCEKATDAGSNRDVP